MLMAVYDGDDEEKLCKCLLSIQHELRYLHSVVIVCDGEINDKKQKLIDLCIPKTHLNLLRLKKNSGLISALNFGLANIDADIVARLDSDDCMIPNRIVEQYTYMQEHKLDICSGHIKEVGGFYETETFRKVPVSQDDILSMLKFRSPFNHMAVMFDLSKIKKLRGYPNIFNNEDYALWLKAAKAGLKLGNMDKTLVIADVPGSFSQRRLGWQRASSEFALAKFRRNLKLFPMWVDYLALILRLTFRLMPSSWAKSVYRTLRSRRCE